MQKDRWAIGLQTIAIFADLIDMLADDNTMLLSDA